MGDLLGGQITATSLAVPRAPLPVLSPTRQSFASPARSRVSPVLLASSHAVSCSRDAADNAVVPRMRACKLEAIAFGDVVSRGSSGKASLSEGSLRSSRVTSSPRPRTKAVSPGGPPIAASSKLAAVLSLSVTAASQISASVMPSPPARFSVTGEYVTSADASKLIRRVNCSLPASTRARIAATASALKVLHIGKRSSPRWTWRAPVAVSRTQTPSRPPLSLSSRLISSISR